MSDEKNSPASSNSSEADINKELAAEQSLGDAAPKKKSVRVSGRKTASKKSSPRKSAKKADTDTDQSDQDLPLGDTDREEAPSRRRGGPKNVVREVRTKLVDPAKDEGNTAEAEGESAEQADSGQQDEDSAPKKQGRQRGQGRQQNGGSRKRGGGERNERQERLPVNAKKLREKAWKIFLAEVSEEGLALVSKSDAHRLAQRSFDVARAFLEEVERIEKH